MVVWQMDDGNRQGEHTPGRLVLDAWSGLAHSEVVGSSSSRIVGTLGYWWVTIVVIHDTWLWASGHDIGGLQSWLSMILDDELLVMILVWDLLVTIISFKAASFWSWYWYEIFWSQSLSASKQLPFWQHSSPFVLGRIDQGQRATTSQSW